MNFGCLSPTVLSILNFWKSPCNQLASIPYILISGLCYWNRNSVRPLNLTHHSSIRINLNLQLSLLVSYNSNIQMIYSSTEIDERPASHFLHLYLHYRYTSKLVMNQMSHDIGLKSITNTIRKSRPHNCRWRRGRIGAGCHNNVFKTLWH